MKDFLVMQWHEPPFYNYLSATPLVDLLIRSAAASSAMVPSAFQSEWNLILLLGLVKIQQPNRIFFF